MGARYTGGVGVGFTAVRRGASGSPCRARTSFGISPVAVGDGGLLVEGESPPVGVTGVGAAHEGAEFGSAGAAGAADVDEGGGVVVDFDEPFVADLVLVPRWCVVE